MEAQVMGNWHKRFKKLTKIYAIDQSNAYFKEKAPVWVGLNFAMACSTRGMNEVIVDGANSLKDIVKIWTNGFTGS